MTALENPVAAESADLLGLTDYARQRPEVVALARALASDRGSHAMVRERLVAEEHFTPEQAELAEISFLRFALATELTNQPVSPPDQADRYWHQFLMHSKPYADWCDRHFGRFLHHRPETRASLEKRGVVQHSLSLYHTYFTEDARLASCANGHDCHGSCTVHRSEPALATCDAHSKEVSA